MRIHGNKSDYYRFLCPHCGQKFTTITHMHGHIRTKHTGDKPYKCESCELGMSEFWFISPSHLFLCHEPLPEFNHVSHFILNTAFHRYDLLAQHKLKHVPRYVCTICGKSLSSNERLKTHSRWVTHLFDVHELFVANITILIPFQSSFWRKTIQMRNLRSSVCSSKNVEKSFTWSQRWCSKQM